MKKRLYWNGCSYLHNIEMFKPTNKMFSLFNPFGKKGETEKSLSYTSTIQGSGNDSIFRRTLIDCTKNDFDFAIIGWSHPQRYLLKTKYLDVNWDTLRDFSEKDFISNKIEDNYGYSNYVPTTEDFNPLKDEPMGTDETILYTISLHHFFKQKGIPHLFLNMGKLSSEVLWARESWLKGIDSKNYLSINDSDTILQKMQFSFIDFFYEFDMKTPYKNGLTIDKDGHLSNIGFEKLFDIITNHIVKYLQ